MNAWRRAWVLGIIGAVAIAHQGLAAQHQEHAPGDLDASNPRHGLISTGHDQIPNFAVRPTAATAGDGNWSDPATWETHRVPGHHDIVLIRSQHRVIYDVVGDETLAVVGIEGVLRFSIDRSTRMESGTVLVLPGGTLEIGSATHPIGSDVQAEIVIADWPLATSGPDDVTGVYDPRQFGTGLLGLGTITMHGAPRSPTFARLAVEPRSGHETLVLESAPTGWRPGDRVFVPDTRHLSESGSPQYRGQWEERILQSVHENTVRLDRDLDHDHRGARDGDGTLDFLPHVGNLGRNVVVRSSRPAGTRGHVLFGDRARVDVRFVLFKDLGRTKEAPLDDTVVDAAGNAVHIGSNQRARYPLSTLR